LSVNRRLVEQSTIAWGFNDYESDKKHGFIARLFALLGESFGFISAIGLPWQEAAVVIKHSLCFVGCRSSNYALAHGVGQKVIVFEPHSARTGWTFAWPYGTEFDATTASLEDSAALAAGMIHVWQEGQGKWDLSHRTRENVTTGLQSCG
jgi:hypothetical protein